MIVNPPAPVNISADVARAYAEHYATKLQLAIQFREGTGADATEFTAAAAQAFAWLAIAETLGGVRQQLELIARELHAQHKGGPTL